MNERVTIFKASDMSAQSSPRDSEVLVRLATGLTQLVLTKCPKSERSLDVSSEIWAALRVWPDINALLQKLSRLGLDSKVVKQTISNISLSFMMEHGVVSREGPAPPPQAVRWRTSHMHANYSWENQELHGKWKPQRRLEGEVTYNSLPIQHAPPAPPARLATSAAPELVHRPNPAPQVSVDTRQVAAISNLRVPVQTSLQALQVLEQLEYTVYTSGANRSEESSKAYAVALLAFLKRPVLSQAEKSSWKNIRDRLERVNSYYSNQVKKEGKAKDQELPKQKLARPIAPVDRLPLHSPVSLTATATPLTQSNGKASGASEEFLETATNIILDVCKEEHTASKTKYSFVYHTLFRLSREGPPQSINDYPWWTSFEEWRKENMQEVPKEQNGANASDHDFSDATIHQDINSISITNDVNHEMVEGETRSKPWQNGIIPAEAATDKGISFIPDDEPGATLSDSSAALDLHCQQHIDTGIDFGEQDDKYDGLDGPNFSMASLPTEPEPESSAQPEPLNDLLATEAKRVPKSSTAAVQSAFPIRLRDFQEISLINGIEPVLDRVQHSAQNTTIAAENRLLHVLPYESRNASGNTTPCAADIANATHNTSVKEDIETAVSKMNKLDWRPQLKTEKPTRKIDVSTVACDVLRAVGRHPGLPTLNASLLYLKDLGLTDKTTDLAQLNFRPLVELDLKTLVEQKKLSDNEAVLKRRKVQNGRPKAAQTKFEVPKRQIKRKRFSVGANLAADDVSAPVTIEILPETTGSNGPPYSDLARNDAVILEGKIDKNSTAKHHEIRNEKLLEISAAKSFSQNGSSNVAADSKSEAPKAFARPSETQPPGDTRSPDSSLSEPSEMKSTESDQRPVPVLRDFITPKSQKQLSEVKSLEPNKESADDTNFMTQALNTSLTSAAKAQFAVNKILGKFLPPVTHEKIATRTKLKRPRADTVEKQNRSEL